MKFNLKSSLSLAVLLLVPHFATAGETKPVEMKDDESTAWMAEVTEFDTSLAQKRVSDKSASRKISAASYGEGDLSEKFKDFRKEFLECKTADCLQGLLDKSEREYETYPADLKFFVAQFQMLRPFRGIVFRLRPIFENFNQSVHSMAVTILRTLASTMRVYLPTDQWEAGFKYVTVPSPNEAQDRQYTKIHQFQTFLVTVAGKSVKKAHDRINAIYKSNLSKPIVWDNKMFYGTGSFDDGLDRYRVYDYAEIAATLGSLSMTLHSVAMFCAYEMDQMLDVAEALGRLAGLNGFKFFEDLGVSARERTKVLRSPSYASFLKLKTGAVDGRALMKASGERLKDAVNEFDSSWTALEPKAQNEYAVLNSALYTPQKHYIDLRLKNMKALIAGNPEIRSPITGETVHVNVMNFFNNPPTDLKALLPTVFDATPDKLTFTNDKNQKKEYRNYFRGMATGWNTAAWSPYFSDVKGDKESGGKNTKDVGISIRVLRNNWGSEFLAFPLDMIIR